MTFFSRFAPLALVLGLSMLVGAAPPARALEGALAEAQVALEPLVLVVGGAHPAEHTLLVEVARDEAQRERGLMFRRYMPADRGMLFDFGTERTVLMWMKNTYIPLDMIFISRAGVVTHVEADTEPMSEAIISSGKPAFAVLEVNAGLAHKLGVKPGDHIRHAMFKP